MYKRQAQEQAKSVAEQKDLFEADLQTRNIEVADAKMQLAMLQDQSCLLYTSDAADERSSVDLGGRRIIKKKKKQKHVAVNVR